MKDFYDFSKMKRVPHPLQHKIDSGELKLTSNFNFDVPDTEFDRQIQHLDKVVYEFMIEKREEWKEEKLLQEISQVEKSCSSQLPLEVINLLEKIKKHLSPIHT
jgi:hypothetical protein